MLGLLGGAVAAEVEAPVGIERNQRALLAGAIREPQIVEAARQVAELAGLVGAFHDMPIGEHGVRTDQKAGADGDVRKLDAADAALDLRQSLQPDAQVELGEMRTDVALKARREGVGRGVLLRVAGLLDRNARAPPSRCLAASGQAAAMPARTSARWG